VASGGRQANGRRTEGGGRRGFLGQKNSVVNERAGCPAEHVSASAEVPLYAVRIARRRRGYDGPMGGGQLFSMARGGGEICDRKPAKRQAKGLRHEASGEMKSLRRAHLDFPEFRVEGIDQPVRFGWRQSRGKDQDGALALRGKGIADHGRQCGRA